MSKDKRAHNECPVAKLAMEYEAIAKSLAGPNLQNEDAVNDALEARLIQIGNEVSLLKPISPLERRF